MPIINPALDASGNGNNWTPININYFTSGSTYDTMTDVPTLTSTTASNFATFNPLMNFAGAFSATPTLSQANLLASGVADTKQYYADSTIQVSSGKWYAEFTPSTVTGDSSYVGIVTSSYLALYAPTGNYYNNSSWASYGATYTTGDVIGVAYDADAGTITFYKNGVSQGQKTGITGTNALFRTSSYNTGASHSWTANFGQRGFAYTPPSGYLALNTFNLPTPTIGATASTQANKYFDALTYTGTGADARAVTGLNFQPDFVWIKRRNDVDYHNLFDVIRGATKRLFSNDTQAENTSAATLQSFNSNGFTVGTNDNVNANGSPLVAWNWNAGGSTVTNTSGSISAQVRANTTAGFSVVTYTGNGSTGTVGHGLGVAPRMIIAKCSGASSQWGVYHASIDASPQNYAILLNSAAAKELNSLYWNNTAPTSTVFSLGGSNAANTNGQAQVAYCFSQVAGYSAFGSYTGNGSGDGPFIYTGFRPRFILVKGTSASRNWYIWDTARNTFNLMNLSLYPNSSTAEITASDLSFDSVSNGFKARGTSIGINNSGETYIYAAFAESPFKYANAR